MKQQGNNLLYKCITASHPPSVLDAESEQLVQQALDVLQQGNLFLCKQLENMVVLQVERYW